MFKIKSKRINPAKSNKMIWAVASGVTLLFVVAALMLFLQKRPANAQERIERTLSYLKRVEGIIAIKVQADSNHILLVYDSNFTKNFENIAHFAALRLADQVDLCTLELARNFPDRVTYRIDIQKGVIVNEERIIPPGG